MSIIRIQKNKDNPYVIVHKGFLEDPNISLKLKGFLAYCLSKPNDWKFHVRHLASVLKEGKDAIYGIIDEGIEHGYITRSEQRIKGKFECVDYIIHETKIKKISTVSGNPDTVNPDTESQTLIINDILTNKDRITPPNPQKGEAPTGASERLAFGKFVSLEKEEHKKLCDDYGFEVVSGLIDEINDYLASSGKKPYRDYAATIRQWIRRRKQAPEQNKHNQSHHQEKKKWLELVKERVKNHRGIDFGPDNVTFHAGQSVLVMKFTDHGLKEQIINRLKMMSIDVSGL